ncbi:MAG: hypothetical protein J7J71_02925 [Deltaproteobacteria bacterium]|nr:hypothetical protein [Candidatus Tharpella sp.]
MINTRKYTKKIVLIGLGLLFAIPAGATDYQSYSLEELNAMRGNLATANSEERETFRNARQEKMQNLTPGERISYQTKGKQRASSNGTGIKTRDGNGNGSMNQYRGNSSSKGGGMGSGQHRRGKR